jgi:hypothetical protein
MDGTVAFEPQLVDMNPPAEALMDDRQADG